MCVQTTDTQGYCVNHYQTHGINVSITIRHIRSLGRVCGPCSLLLDKTKYFNYVFAHAYCFLYHYPVLSFILNNCTDMQKQYH